MPADPAAEQFKYPVSIDVRDLITLDDAMEELQLGPNGWVVAWIWAVWPSQVDLTICYVAVGFHTHSLPAALLRGV